METLYKYLSADRADVLTSGKIRFSSIVSLNDPFELKPHISALASEAYISNTVACHLRASPEVRRALDIRFPGLDSAAKEALLETFISNLDPNGDLIRAESARQLDVARNGIYSGFEREVGVLCLSESHTSLLMWAHYADSHRGFVIGFNRQHSFFNRRATQNDELRHLRRVTYRLDRPSIVLSEMSDFTPFLTKGLEWSYECEWRMLVPLSQADGVVGTWPTEVHLFSFPKESVTQVIFGCKASAELRQTISDVIASDPAYANVELLECAVDSTAYKVNVIHYAPLKA